MNTLRVEAQQEGTNLSRLEGLRLIAGALGGKITSVTARPSFDEYWQLEIAVLMPAEGQQRFTQVATKLLDGPVNVTHTGTREGPEDE